MSAEFVSAMAERLIRDGYAVIYERFDLRAATSRQYTFYADGRCEVSLDGLTASSRRGAREASRNLDRKIARRAA